jgi:hypothetical protein
MQFFQLVTSQGKTKSFLQSSRFLNQCALPGVTVNTVILTFSVFLFFLSPAREPTEETT